MKLKQLPDEVIKEVNLGGYRYLYDALQDAAEWLKKDKEGAGGIVAGATIGVYEEGWSVTLFVAYEYEIVE